MKPIALSLQAVRSRIEKAALDAGRRPADVCLLAVSKTFPASYIEDAIEAGQAAFGESYVQEAVKKITQVRRAAEWHFIGPIQSNKTAQIANCFSWVHGIDREKIARRLDAARPADLPPLQVCLQVNVSGESSKSGVAPGEERALAKVIAGLPRLRLRGLMAIPEPTDDPALARSRYAEVRRMMQALCAEGYALDTLSMGMSDDLEAAIAEGATIVRVGTAIFGVRDKAPAAGTVE